MSNIEEDIKILESMLEEYYSCSVPGMNMHIDIYFSLEQAEAIEHILAKREQNKKRIKELEAKLEFKNWGDLDNTQFEEYMNQFIPKQKVKDKIEENNKIMIDTQNKYPGTYAMLDEWRNAKAQNDILEELLEDK